MVVQEDDLSFHDGFYCEECQALYQDQSDFHGVGGPSFILDSPTPMGALQRALLTLPHGLMIGRSSIPGAGLGVINQGPTLSPGMHFGPFEGEVTARESAVESAYSWEVCKEKDEYEYIDGARDTHSNWMRYVNCARNEEERNLLVVQYRERVLFHCCRSIHQGDELMVWPSKTYLSQISEAWNQIWLKKCTPTVLENNLVMATQIFPCSQCQLPFTTESYLLRHTEHFHSPPQEDCSTPGFEAVEPGSPPPNSNSQHHPPSATLEEADTEEDEEDRKCPECGKIFKHSHHLKRHKFNVHSNKRPYCCVQCRRCFSQACGLLRHQLVHKKTEAAAVKEAVDSTPVSQISESEIPPPDDATEESPATPTEEAGDEPGDVSHKCSACEREFTNQYHLKRHMLSVHSNNRPYGCTQCKKCFGQSSDLARHLKVHQRRKRQAEVETTATDTFHCANCSLSFFEGESLQLHMKLHPAEEAAGEEDPEELGGESLSPSDVNQDDQDPNFVAPPSVTKAAGVSPRPLSQRLQRAGARSKMSAITRLLAPKRRAVTIKKEGPSVETSNGEGVAEHDDPSKLTAGDAKSRKWFSCGDCKGTYGNPDDLQAHECAKAKGQHDCLECDATFKRLVSLKRHERAAHARGTSHSCDRCGKVYKKATGLQRHQKGKGCEKIHTAELFPCAHCQFSFTMKSYLHKHVKRHHPVEYVALMESGTELVLTRGQDAEEGEGHTCPHCGKRYVNAKRFKAHKCFSQMEILYLCTDCGKGFTNHYGLKQHQRIHTGEKPYTCPHCTKSFHYVGQLNVHLRTHTGEKPYLCTHCGESFRQSGDLKRHERKHTGVRPHKCPKCDKCFSRPQSLKAHQMLHQGQRMFKCTQCGKSFSRNYHLRRHHVKMHS